MSSSSCLIFNLFSAPEFSYFRREFQLHYQPIVSLETGKVRSFEAFIRWQKDGMMLYPDEFMPTVQATGMIMPLCVWIMQQACQQIMRWQEQFVSSNLRISINISLEQLSHPQFIHALRAVLSEAGIGGKHLQLEIPAKVLRLNTPEIRRRLEQIKELGVCLLVDNFNPSGTPLTSLHDYGINAIKINQLAVSSLRGHPVEIDAFETVIGWLQNLGIDIILNRIDTLDQVALHQSYGCKYGQGTLFSQPLSARDMTMLLAEKSTIAQTRLDAHLMAVSKLKQTLKRFLSHRLVTQYWIESKPAESPVVTFDRIPSLQGLQNFGAFPIDMRFQTILQKWVENFVVRCGHILRDLPWMLNHSDLTARELQLLKIQSS